MSDICGSEVRGPHLYRPFTDIELGTKQAEVEKMEREKGKAESEIFNAWERFYEAVIFMEIDARRRIGLLNSAFKKMAKFASSFREWDEIYEKCMHLPYYICPYFEQRKRQSFKKMKESAKTFREWMTIYHAGHKYVALEKVVEAASTYEECQEIVELLLRLKIKDNLFKRALRRLARSF